MISKDDKIRLIVIGDSISSGFNSRFGYCMPGLGSTFSKDKEFLKYGLSYGSFFCDYISKIDTNKIEWYENFAIQGSRIDEWKYFYTNDKSKYQNSKVYLDTMILIDSKDDKLNFFKDRLKLLYNNFDINRNDNFDFLIQKTKEANLMFFTLGGPDLFIDMPTFDIIDDISNGNGKNIMKIFDDIYQNLYDKIFGLVQHILTLNPTLHIVIPSFPLPFNMIQESFNFFLEKKYKFNFNFYDLIIKKSSSFISKLAVDFENISFIDIYDPIFWQNNKSSLTSYFYEIHPSTKGYKKIAKNILFKMLYGNSIDFETANKLVPSFEKESYNNNSPFYKKIIDFSFDNDFIMKKLQWDQSINEEDLFLDNNIEKFFSTFGGAFFSTNYFLVARNIIERNSIETLKKFLSKIDIPFLKYEKSLKNQFFDYEYKHSLFHIIVNGNFFDNVINDGIDFIIKNYSYELKNILYNKTLIFILRKIAFEFLTDNRLYQIFKYLNSKNFFNGNLDNAKNLSQFIVKIIFNEQFFDKFINKRIYSIINKILSLHFIYLIDFVKEEQLKTIFLYWYNNSKAITLLENFIFTIFKNFVFINNYKSFAKFLEDQIDYYFNLNIADLIQLIQNFFTNEENSNVFIIFLINKLKIWNLTLIQFNKLRQVIISLIEIILNSWSNNDDDIKNILNVVKLLIKYLLYPNNKFSYGAWWKVSNNLVRSFLQNVSDNKEYLEKNNFIEHISWIINLLFDHLDSNSAFFNFILNKNKIKNVLNKFNINLFSFKSNKKLIGDFQNIVVQVYKSLFKKYDEDKLKSNWSKYDSESYHTIFRVTVAIYYWIISIVNNAKLTNIIKRKVVESIINNLSTCLYLNLSSYKELIRDFYLKKIKISSNTKLISIPDILVNMLLSIEKSVTIFQSEITNKELILIWLKLGFLDKKIINGKQKKEK